MSEAIWAVLPVKALGWAKRRLAGQLSPAERRALMVRLCETGLVALREVLPGERIVVVSHDRTALGLAASWGARGLHQVGYGLNAAVREGEALAQRNGADALLVLLADLPLVTGAELRRFLALAKADGERELVLAPGQRGGTHALLIRPLGWLPYAYGHGSARRHLAAAHEAGARVAHYESLAMGLDVDTWEDLQRALRARPDLLDEAA